MPSIRHDPQQETHADWLERHTEKRRQQILDLLKDIELGTNETEFTSSRSASRGAIAAEFYAAREAMERLSALANRGIDAATWAIEELEQ